MRNISTGVLAALWAALLGFAVVPVYVHLLGVEAYGMVGFLATLQALAQALDMGVAPTVNREVARRTAGAGLQETLPMLRALTRMYWLTAVLLALGIAAAAPFISTHWLQSKTLSVTTIQQAVMLLGAVIAARWPNGLYAGMLMGTQRLELSSAVTAGTATLTAAGSVAVLLYVSNTIQALFAWQTVAALLGTLAMRWAAWRAISPDAARPPPPDFARLKGLLRRSAGMALLGIFGLIFTQLDKVLLSRMLPLPEFGRYMLAIAITGGLYVLVMPFFNAVYPRFSALATHGDSDGLGARYRLGTSMLATALFPLAGFLAWFSSDLVTVWTRNAELGRSVGPLVSLLAMGSALHGIMHIPHALQLASGETRLPLMINGGLLIVMVPLTIGLASHFGALGGAAAWLILHCLYFVVGSWLTHRRLLRSLRYAWPLHDVALPLLASVALAATACWVAREAAPGSAWARLAIGLAAAGVSAIVCVALSEHLRAVIKDRLRRVPHRPLGTPPAAHAE